MEDVYDKEILKSKWVNKLNLKYIFIFNKHILPIYLI